MSIETVGGTDVDVCAACGGVWVDWFGGEFREIASGIVAGGVTGRASDPGSVRNEARAIGACPRCSRQLVSERYVVKTLGASARGPKRRATDTGAELRRCEDCAGAFLSRTSVEVLAALTPDPAAAPRSEPQRAAAASPLDRLGAALRGLFSKGSSKGVR
jgi:Zn-finger nucleic acid-binding protein